MSNRLIAKNLACNGCAVCVDANGMLLPYTGGSVMVSGSGYCSIIGNGCNNTASGCFSTISGGASNCICSGNSSILGGQLNIIGCYNLSGATCLTTNSCAYCAGASCLIFLGDFTTDIPVGSCVAYFNRYCSKTFSGVVTSSTFSGGCTKLVSPTFQSGGFYLPFRVLSRICNDPFGVSGQSTISGGAGNLITRYYSNIGGGILNTVSCYYSNIGGGYGNTATGNVSSILGGDRNFVSGASSSILGGENNIISGQWSGGGGCSICNTCSRTFQWNCLRASNLIGTTVGVCVGTDGILVRGTSDVRCKTDITPISYGLNEVSMLNPVSFNWCDDIKSTFGDNRQVGFIAQEVEKVIPEAVGQSAEGVYSMDINKIVPALVKSVQEISDRLNKLENKS
jgi:hypothetical protein